MKSLAPAMPPGAIKMPLGLRAKLATSNGRPAAVAVELLDGSNRPALMLLSRQDATALIDQLTKARDQLPEDILDSIEVGAA